MWFLSSYYIQKDNYKNILSIKFLGLYALLVLISTTSSSIAYSQTQSPTQTENQTSLVFEQERMR